MKYENLKILKDNNINVPNFDVVLWKDRDKEIDISNYKGKYAIRSSSNFEDKDNLSAAGQFETYLNVPKRLINKRVKDCFNSINNKNVNLFSFESKIENNIKSNLYLKDYNIKLNKSTLKIETNDLKTITGKIINEKFTIETFAPSKYQIYNVLACVCVALSSNISPNQIKDRLSNYKGIKGRSSVKVKNNVNIIEEINPGLNVTAVKKAIFMGLNLDNPCIILGGEYGITCEEIDEKELAKTIDEILDTNPKMNLILTDKLGLGIKKYSKQNFTYIKSPNDSIDFAINNQISNIIFIYR